MDVAERIFKLIDQVELLEFSVQEANDNCCELRNENRNLADEIVQLTAELKAEKAVAKINEQALVSCEKQLGMDEEAEKLKAEGHPVKLEDGSIRGCIGCRHYGKDCYSIVGDCIMHEKWEPMKPEKAPILPSESVEDGQPTSYNTQCPEASECKYGHLRNTVCVTCEPVDGKPNFVETL